MMASRRRRRTQAMARLDLYSDYIKGLLNLLTSAFCYTSQSESTTSIIHQLFAIMNPMFVVHAFLLLVVGNLCVSAAPLEVFDPPVLTPNASTVWTVGQPANITW